MSTTETEEAEKTERKRRLEELEAAREDRGIRVTYFAAAIGYDHHSSWTTAVDRGSVSDEKLRAARYVLEYHDEHGYLPTPDELEAAVGGRGGG